MPRRTLALLAALAALALIIAGCGGGSDSASVPTITAPTSTGGATGSTGKQKAKKESTAKSPSPGPTAAPAAEKKCGKVFFPGTESQEEVTAANLPCPKALAYAKRFVKGEQPSQANLPPGWNIHDCTGISSSAPTPGEPNSPRCHRGQQVFTIHITHS